MKKLEAVRCGGIISSPLRLHSSSYQISRLVSIFPSDLMSHKYALFDIDMDTATQRFFYFIGGQFSCEIEADEKI